MSLLDDFATNTEIFKGAENRLDKDAFEALIDKYGLDVAKGYMLAVYEMTNQIGDAMVVYYKETLPMRETLANFYGKISNIHRAMLKFIEENGLPIEAFKPPNPNRTRHKGW